MTTIYVSKWNTQTTDLAVPSTSVTCISLFGIYGKEPLWKTTPFIQEPLGVKVCVHGPCCVRSVGKGNTRGFMVMAGRGGGLVDLQTLYYLIGGDVVYVRILKAPHKLYSFFHII